MRNAFGAGLVLSFLLLPDADPQKIPPVQEIVDVTVANVEVVVTDRAGNRVRGLTREDFELLEEGVPQRIANFAEFDEEAIGLEIAVEAEAPDLRSRTSEPPEVPPRRVVIYWDLSMDPGKTILQRPRIENAIGTILDELEPRDEVMVVSWNGTLTVEVPPTHDVDAVRQGIRRLVDAAPLGRVASRTSDPCNPNFQKRAFALLVEEHQRSTVALRTVLSRLTPLRGRKALVLISQGFVAQPALEINLCGLPKGGGELINPLLGEAGGRLMSANTSRSLDRFAVDLNEVKKSKDLMDALIRTANAGGVALYTIHGAGLVAPEVTELPTISDEPLLLGFAGIGNSIVGLRRIAEETGGLLAANTNDFKGAFREISADLGSYYSIGYRVADAKREGDRHIDIRMRNPALSARARRAVSVRSPEAEVSDALLASLEFGDAASDLAISAVPQPVTKPRRGQFTIPIEVRIPLEPLSFVQERDSFVANVSIFVAAADSEKASSEVERLDHAIRIPAADFAGIAGSYYTYRLTIDLRGRSAGNRVAIAVLDTLSKLSGFTLVDAAPGAPSRQGVN